MEERRSVVHIWLVTDGGGGLAFLSDMRRMIEAVARRHGTVATATRRADGGPGSKPHLFLSVSGSLRWAEADVGVHRAQVVPADSQTGRVETSLVGVELLEAGADGSSTRPVGPVLKTYNYILGQVTRHATGEQVSLAAVLSGDPE